jgi:hypothetical protein
MRQFSKYLLLSTSQPVIFLSIFQNMKYLFFFVLMVSALNTDICFV